MRKHHYDQGYVRERYCANAMLFVHTVLIIYHWCQLRSRSGFWYHVNPPTILISTGNCLYPDNIYLFKVDNGNTRTMNKNCWNLKVKKTERCYWYRSGDFFVNFEEISQIGLVLLLLTLNKKIPDGKLNKLGWANCFG